MPVYHFKCECGNEFEKMVAQTPGFYQWCKHCNALTTWEIIKDLHAEYYNERICTVCLGSLVKPPIPESERIPVQKKDVTEPCPVCGKAAEHILRLREPVSHDGTGPTTQGGSVTFRFNYMEP